MGSQGAKAFKPFGIQMLLMALLGQNMQDTRTVGLIFRGGELELALIGAVKS